MKYKLKNLIFQSGKIPMANFSGIKLAGSQIIPICYREKNPFS